MKDQAAPVGIAWFIFGIFVLLYFRELFVGIGHMINGVAIFIFLKYGNDRKITFLSVILLFIGLSFLAYEAAGIYLK